MRHRFLYLLDAHQFGHILSIVNHRPMLHHLTSTSDHDLPARCMQWLKLSYSGFERQLNLSSGYIVPCFHHLGLSGRHRVKYLWKRVLEEFLLSDRCLRCPRHIRLLCRDRCDFKSSLQSIELDVLWVLINMISTSFLLCRKAQPDLRWAVNKTNQQNHSDSWLVKSHHLSSQIYSSTEEFYSGVRILAANSQSPPKGMGMLQSIGQVIYFSRRRQQGQMLTHDDTLVG